MRYALEKLDGREVLVRLGERQVMWQAQYVLDMLFDQTWGACIEHSDMFREMSAQGAGWRVEGKSQRVL